MYCIDCGQAQPVKDARFCPFCGDALVRPPVAEGVLGSGGAAPPAPLSAPGEPAVLSVTGTAGTQGAAPASASRDAVQDPSNYPLAVALDRARWVVLKGQSSALRSRLRLALGVTLALAVVLGAATWWWAHQEEPGVEDGIEVERIEGEPAQAKPTKPSKP